MLHGIACNPLEATGILAGDALLAFAFEELARLERGGVPARRVVEAVSRLAYASGGERLVGGQALDLAAEGRPATRRAVANIHWNKTGALMGAAMALGGIAGGASPRRATRLEWGNPRSAHYFSASGTSCRARYAGFL